MGDPSEKIEVTETNICQQLKHDSGFSSVLYHDRAMLDAFGGKAMGLLELDALGLPIPKGFFTPVLESLKYFQKNQLSPELQLDILDNLRLLEAQTGKKIGDKNNPLLFAVRSGGPYSMPGIMETILNVGLNDETVVGLANEIGEKKAWMTYYKLIKSFGINVFNQPESDFAQLDLQQKQNPEMTVDDLQSKVSEAKQILQAKGNEFSQNPLIQIKQAVTAVFESARSDKAREYLHLTREIPPEMVGTAAIIMEMKMGNAESPHAGSGVLITRNNLTYDNEPKISFKFSAQGDSVVGTDKVATGGVEVLPEVSQEEMRKAIELINRRNFYPQDIEFVIDKDGHIWFLQKRDAHMVLLALLRYINTLLDSDNRLIEHVMRLITTNDLQALRNNPPLDPVEVAKAPVIGMGQTITSGHASSVYIRSVEDIQAMEESETPYILIVDDIAKINLIKNHQRLMGIGAANGSTGSHAARLAERSGVPVIFGVDTTAFNSPNTDQITIDADSGRIFLGEIPVVKDSIGLLTNEESAQVEDWIKKRRENPWCYTVSDEIYAVEKSEAEAAEVKKAISSRQGLKAQEYEAFNRVFPEYMRLDYQVLSREDYDKVDVIKEQLKTTLNDSKCDVTIRTSHNPPITGGGPYVVLTTPDEVDHFFSSEGVAKYGNWDRLINGEQPSTEVLICAIPKDKLSHNPEIEKCHAAFSITVNDQGVVIVQIKPGTARLRDLENAKHDDLITYNLHLATTDGKRNVKAAEIIYGDKITHEQKKLVNILTLQLDRLGMKEIRAKLATLQDYFPHIEGGHRVIALEGQMRIPEPWLNGQEVPNARNVFPGYVNYDQWMLFYGIKADFI